MKISLNITRADRIRQNINSLQKAALFNPLDTYDRHNIEDVIVLLNEIAANPKVIESIRQIGWNYENNKDITSWG